MEYLASFIAFFLFPVIGIMSIFVMSFSLVYVVIQTGLFLAAKFLPRKLKNYYYWVLSLSSIFLWLSIFVSRHDLADTSVLTKCSTAGFPFKVFTFPCGAMGGDYVPIEMWLPFYLNYFAWIIIGTLLVWAVSKFKFIENVKAKRILFTAYVIINLAGLGWLLLAFD